MKTNGSYANIKEKILEQEAKESFKYLSDEQLMESAYNKSTLGKRFESFDAESGALFTVTALITVVGAIATSVVYHFVSSWIVLLVAGLLLAIPAASVVIFSMLAIGHVHSKKNSYKLALIELNRREKSANL